MRKLTRVIIASTRDIVYNKLQSPEPPNQDMLHICKYQIVL